MKNFFFAVLFLIVSCQNSTPTIEKKATTNPNQPLIEQYFTHFNRHDWPAMAAMYTDTAEFKDPALGQEIVPMTHAEIIKKYGELQQAVPDVKDKVVNVYPSGDKNIIVEFVSTGTGPDGKKFELPICTVFAFENGKIVKDFTYYDNF